MIKKIIAQGNVFVPFRYSMDEILMVTSPFYDKDYFHMLN